MSSDSNPEIANDQLIGKLAVAQRFITPRQLETLLARQEELRLEGSEISFSELLIEEELLDEAQLKELLGHDRVVGGYRLLHRLGKGGMGAVYKAVRLKDNRTAAVKLMTFKRSRDKKFVARFIEESRMLSKMKHPNVVMALEFGKDDGFHFFAMEFVEGETLIDRIEREGELTEMEMLRIGSAIAEGLQAACEVNVIHRDIKPENILLRPDGGVKVSDFGLAKDRTGGLKTTEGITFGTPHYMSPEQVRGSQDLDTRSDIYSLGATLYHAVTGKFPFDGENDMEIMVKHLDDKPVPLRKVAPHVSRATAQLIGSMMSLKREDRPSTPGGVAISMRQIMDGKGPNVLQSVGRTVGQTTRRVRSGLQKMPASIEQPGTRRLITIIAWLTAAIFVVNLIYLLLKR